MTLGSSIKYAVFAVALILFVICGAIGLRYLFYPYGNRGSGLVGVTVSLRNYAVDHQGWFPNSSSAPLPSLKMLYPYDDSGDLVGLSGDLREGRKRTQLGLDLDETTSTLIYFPGLRDSDDADLMILYERQEGICTTGQRASGHAVGFVAGYVRQIPQKDWKRFLKDQEALRARAMANRFAPTNTGLLISR